MMVPTMNRGRLIRKRRHIFPKTGWLSFKLVSSPGEEFLVEKPVLHRKRLVEVEGGPVAREVFLREARVQGVDLARLPRREMDDQKTHDRDDEERHQLEQRRADDVGAHV